MRMNKKQSKAMMSIGELVTTLLTQLLTENVPVVTYFDSPEFGNKRAIRDIYEWFIQDEINTEQELCEVERRRIGWEGIVRASMTTDASIRKESLVEFIVEHGFYRNIRSVIYSATKRHGTQDIDSSALVIGTAQLDDKIVYFAMDYDSSRCDTCGSMGEEVLEHHFQLYFASTLPELVNYCILCQDVINIGYDIISPYYTHSQRISKHDSQTLLALLRNRHERFIRR